MALNIYTPDNGRSKLGECGKVCFDKKSAQTKMNWLLKQGKARYLRIYQCPICNSFHLTHVKQGYIVEKYKDKKFKKDYDDQNY